ncbi:MAG: sigma-70 family RNA polymerase sigma factor [Verrucomicrobiae bacterium]|nr:sigma-70 family RNA polymerase sigma factor [Verrucomicrobiae bacterium]
MNDWTDQQLLHDYAAHRSEAAFTELVRRHIDLVHSAAFRMAGEAHTAQDVTQSVFVALAQNAGRLTHHPVLTGWLHTTARNLAAKNIRAAARRQNYEQEAAAMNELLSEGSTGAAPVWSDIAPHLDAALGELGEADREVVLLRYFEGKSAGEIGRILGISAAAAQKRVSRAVEQLREFFANCGVSVGAGGLVVVISANAVQSAPMGLAATISAAALAGAAVSSATVVATTKTMVITTLQKTLATATLAALAGAGIYEARQAAQLRGQMQALRQQQAPLIEQIAQLQSDKAALSNRLTQATGTASLSDDQLRELLKLRGEIGALRQQQRELEQRLSSTESPAGQSISQPSSPPISGRAAPAPFQLQLVLNEPGEDSELMTNNVRLSTGTVLPQMLRVQKTPLMNDTAVRLASVITDPVSGRPKIEIEFSDVGRELLAAITRENLNKRLAVVLDGRLYSAPVIQSEISGGKVQIIGDFTEEEAQTLAAKINDAVAANTQSRD